MEKSYTRGRPVHPEYHKLGFRRIKVDGKSSVVCEHCKCVLQNTATKRLRGHRNVCQMTPKSDNVKQEAVPDRVSPTEDSYQEAVSAKDEDPLNSYTRTNSSYIELQPPSPGIEYAAYSDESDDARLPPRVQPTRPPATRKRPRTEPDNVVDVVKQMLETFTGVLQQQQKIQTPTAEFGDEAFCNWLLSQFASMGPQRKLRVQHEISNMVFRAHAEDANADM